MKKHSFKTLFLIFGLVLVTKPAHAFVKNLEELCGSIHAERVEEAPVENHQLSPMTQLRMQISPNNYIGVSSNQIISTPAEKTIIFTMKPDMEVPDRKIVKQNEKLNYKRSKKTQGHIKKLVKTKNVSDCLSKAHSLGMTNEQLNEYGEILKQSTLNNQLYQAGLFLEFADKASKKFKNGEVLATSEAELALDALSSLPEGKYNFIFVLHADPKGRLVDYSNYIVERGFFKKVAGKAASISIFSCYPDKVSAYYSKELDYLANVGVAVFQPVLKKELKEINSTPLNLLEAFSGQLAESF